MVNEEAWPAGVKTGLIPWELPFHFFNGSCCSIMRYFAADNNSILDWTVTSMLVTVQSKILLLLAAK